MDTKTLNIRLHNCKNEINAIDDQFKTLRKRRKELSEEISLIESQLSTQNQNNTGDQFLTANFEWSNKVQHILETVFKFKSFRSHQLATINAILSGYDVLLIIPTSGGKSLCFQLTSLVNNGVTLVISPLISLMEDQLNSLNSLGIPTAILNSNTTKERSSEILKALEKVNNIGFKILYVTPEKLAKSKRIMVQLEKCYKNRNLKFLVIDEVHCCSQWGHDFRTDYQFLGIMRNQFPETPILGLTATATPAVIADIQKILNIKGCYVFKDSFYRSNLTYLINRVDEMKKDDQVNSIAHLVTTRFRKQSGLIYCLTVREVEELAEKLCTAGVRAAAYHAQMQMSQRSRVYQDWFHNRKQVIVATVAFGMGINKLDVRFVIHASMSKSLENYYQETGRAGRDGEPAECILYFKFADIFRATTLVFSEKNGLSNVYSMVAYCVNQKTCLKEQISNYFGDEWNNVCNAKCDNCQRNLPHETMNVTQDVEELVRILRHTTSLDKRLTAPKLVEIWLGKGEKKLRPENLKVCRYTREIGQSIILSLLLNNYLKEEFHFTPYSTISYINVGPMWLSRGISSNSINYILPCTNNLKRSQKSIVSSKGDSSSLSSSTKAAAASAKKSKKAKDDIEVYCID